MQKFILTFLFLGLLVSMLYLPAPMDKIEAAIERDEFPFLHKKDTHHSSVKHYQASSEPYQSPFSTEKY